MSPATIHKRVLQRPFQSFRVCLSDGVTYDVREPEMILVTRREVLIAQPKPGETMARHVIYCDPLHITHIEPNNGRTAKPGSKTRRERDE
jgi:hypothetical protein